MNLVTSSKGIVMRSIKRHLQEWLRKATVIVWDLVVFTLTYWQISYEDWQ